MRDKVSFGPFELDRANETLASGSRQIPLTPRAFSLLDYMIERGQQLVTKRELLDNVWSDSIVGDAVLKVCVNELRKALGDNPRDPAYIQTVHRRGYRFIADVGAGAASAAAPARSRPPTELIARETALEKLEAALTRAAAAERQLVFVTGDPGVGKTSLIEAFAAAVEGRGGVRVARGQCIEHYGSGEAYLPFFEAIGRLSRTPGADDVVEILERFAPTWVAQMPALAKQVGEERLRQEVLGATRERMLREMAEALEVMTETTPLVLLLEDLHWSDFSSLDLITLLARRPGPARLLVIGTYRPIDLIISKHPLRGVVRELASHQSCREIPLEVLGEGDVRDWLTLRFAGTDIPERLAPLIQRRTGGNPLFLVHALDHLRNQGVIEEDEAGARLAADTDKLELGVPEGVRPVIEKRMERLDPAARELLEAASVAGFEFDLAAVAEALERDVEDAEELCDELASGHELLRQADPVSWPDGRISARYAFRHSLIQNVLYDGLPPSRRARLHRAIATCLEAAFGDETDDLATALALHFEEGRQPGRALDYLVRAARTASRRHAGHEALELLERGTGLLRLLAGTERRDALMRLLQHKGLVKRGLGDMKGAADEFEALAATARESGAVRREVQSLLYLGSALFWVERERCLATVDKALETSQRVDDEGLRRHVRGWCGHWNLTLRGWRDEDAQDCLAAVAAAREAGDRRRLSLHLVRSVYLEMLRSRYDDAAAAAREARGLAIEQGDGFDYLLAHFFAGWALLHAGRWGDALRELRRGSELAERNGHELWVLLFRLVEAQLREQAFDFAGADELGRPPLEHARKTPGMTGQLLFHGSIVLALVELGRGEIEQAGDHLDETSRIIEDHPHEVDWMLRFPLGWGRALAKLQAGRWTEAITESDRLASLARRSNERTYLGLAAHVEAEARLALGEVEEAGVRLDDARTSLDTAPTPIAAWRLHATAAKVCEARRDTAAASAARADAAAVLRRLADSLDGFADIETCLRASAAWAEVAAGADG